MPSLIDDHLRVLRFVSGPRTTCWINAQKVLHALRCLYKDIEYQPLFTEQTKAELNQLISAHPFLSRAEMVKRGFVVDPKHRFDLTPYLELLSDPPLPPSLPPYLSSDENDDEENPPSHRRGGYAGPSDVDYQGKPDYPWDDHDVEFS
jgi:hypothetical protein